MKKIILLLIYIFTFNELKSNENFLLKEKRNIYIYDIKVFKRNKASCKRLGNIYDACQWMLKFSVKNNTKYHLKSFCSVAKINNRNYKICSQNKSKIVFLNPKESKQKLTNLSELIGYKNDYPKPQVVIKNVKGKFIKLKNSN